MLRTQSGGSWLGASEEEPSDRVLGKLGGGQGPSQGHSRLGPLRPVWLARPLSCMICL